jgi:hypothetical protein
VFARSQVSDYIFRGDFLAQFNVLQFFVDTYEESSKKDNDRSSTRNDVDEESQPVQGRPRHARVKYKEIHPRHGTQQRVIRPLGHRNLPNFVGRYFPRNDDPYITDFYFASVLTLLKPWRSLATDLKEENESWSSAFDSFIATAPERVKSVITGLQYFHECQTKAQETSNSFEGEDFNEHVSVVDEEDLTREMEPDETDPSHQDTDHNLFITEEIIQDLLCKQIPEREQLHGEKAVQIATQVGIFQSNTTNNRWALNSRPQARNANQDDVQQLQNWKEQMEREISKRNDIEAHTSVGAIGGDEDEENMLGTGATVLGELQQSEEVGGITVLQPEIQIAPVRPELLNSEQHRAYQIITTHLRNNLTGQKTPPLRMILCGEGGTGKSKVIQTITDAFVEAGNRYKTHLSHTKLITI